jgi:hypothetical protein
MDRSKVTQYNKKHRNSLIEEESSDDRKKNTAPAKKTQHTIEVGDRSENISVELIDNNDSDVPQNDITIIEIKTPPIKYKKKLTFDDMPHLIPRAKLAMAAYSPKDGSHPIPTTETCDIEPLSEDEFTILHDKLSEKGLFAQGFGFEIKKSEWRVHASFFHLRHALEFTCYQGNAPGTNGKVLFVVFGGSGTDPFMVADHDKHKKFVKKQWKTNIQSMFDTKISGCHLKAAMLAFNLGEIIFTTELLNDLKCTSIEFSGHSRGGLLAALAALGTNDPRMSAYCFNAMRINQQNYKWIMHELKADLKTKESTIYWMYDKYDYAQTSKILGCRTIGIKVEAKFRSEKVKKTPMGYLGRHADYADLIEKESTAHETEKTKLMKELESSDLVMIEKNNIKSHRTLRSSGNFKIDGSESHLDENIQETNPLNNSDIIMAKEKDAGERTDRRPSNQKTQLLSKVSLNELTDIESTDVEKSQQDDDV